MTLSYHLKNILPSEKCRDYTAVASKDVANSVDESVHSNGGRVEEGELRNGGSR